MGGTPYTQTQSYIPSTDSGFRDFLNNFATLIAANPGKYDLEASDAQVLMNHNDTYEAAYVPCQSAATRTTGLVTQKDAVKAAAIASVRVYAMLIKNNAGISDQDKLELGLHLNDTTRTPIPAPSSAPILMIVSAFSGEHQIRYADENTPASRRKPEGAVQMQLNQTVGIGANPDPNASELVGLFTRQPIRVSQDPMNVGKTATYFARWVNAKGEFGPWSLPVAMTIAFGGPVDQQMFIPDGGQTMTGDGGSMSIAA